MEGKKISAGFSQQALNNSWKPQPNKICYLHKTNGKVMIEQTGALTNLQLELLQMFRYELDEGQLLEVRELLAKYFADKATQEMDRLWDEKGWTEETMENWSKEHMRTKYEDE